MNIQYPAVELVNERRGQNSHEARENDEIRLILAQCFDERRIKFFSLRIVLVPHAFRADVGFTCTLQSGGLGPVAQYDGQIKIEFSGGGFIDERLQICTTARNENRRIWPAQM